jgi:hypothetical protein
MAAFLVIVKWNAPQLFQSGGRPIQKQSGLGDDSIAVWPAVTGPILSLRRGIDVRTKDQQSGTYAS